jgi:hypothetical protein
MGLNMNNILGNQLLNHYDPTDSTRINIAYHIRGWPFVLYYNTNAYVVLYHTLSVPFGNVCRGIKTYE